MSDALKLEGFDELYGLLQEMPDLALRAGEMAMKQTLMTLHGKLPEYPNPPDADAPSPLVTLKQRRWFFAAVRKGQIPGWQWVNDEFGGHPEGRYPRTETLGRQFTEQVERIEGGIIGEIGTATPYAPWVVGPDYPGRNFEGRGTMYQARIHQGRWWQFEDVIAENTDETTNEFTKTFFREFKRLAGSTGGK